MKPTITNLIAGTLLATGLGSASAQSVPVVLDPLPGDSLGVPALPDSAAAYGRPVPAEPQSSHRGKKVTLSRQQCLEIALQDNPTIKVADMEIQRADISRKETRGSLLPDISFAGAYQRAIELQTINMNMGGQNQSLKMGSDNTWNFGFTATLPLVAPQLWKSLSISDTQILANYESARASRLNLVYQVNQAYYTLLLARASYDVLKENYELVRYNAEIYEKQYSFGTATEYDVLRSSVQVKNLEPELLQAQIAIDRAMLQLKVLMGIADPLEIEPDVTLADLRDGMYGYVSGIDRDLAGNTDLRNLDIQTKLLEQTVELKKSAFLPTLAASFNINWNALSDGNAFRRQQFHPYSTVGLTLSVPLFSGGSRYYGVKGAELQVREAKLQRENLVNTLDMQVQLAIDNINKEVKQIDTSAEGMREAEKARQIMQKSFEIGAASYLNLRDSELAETAAKLTYYQAIYNYLLSTCELDLLLGHEDDFRAIGYTYPTRK